MNYHIQNIGAILATGKDTIDFLNRVTTNDLRNFSVNTRKRTLLLNEKGKIVDIIDVIYFADYTLLLTSPGNEEEIISFLDKFVINDDVKFLKSVSDYSNLQIFGDDAFEFVKIGLGFDLYENNNIVIINDRKFVFTDDFRRKSINIICKGWFSDDFLEKFKNINKLSFTEYEADRIKNAIPAFPGELSNDIIPLECGLKEFISFNKGCYIGQEIVARLEAQNKIPKTMVRISSDSVISAKDMIYFDDEKCGFVSSCISENELYQGLGFIKSVNLDFQKKYHILQNGKKIKIEILKIIL